MNRDEEQLPDIISSSSEDDTTSDSSSDDSSNDDNNYNSSMFDDELSDRDEIPSHMKGSYKIVNLSEIQEFEQSEISSLCRLITVTTAEAIVYLLHFKWNQTAISDAWSANSSMVKHAVGIPDPLLMTAGPISPPSSPDSPEPEDDDDVLCSNCEGHVDHPHARHAFCDHKYCAQCWREVIGAAIRECNLLQKCPVDICDAPVNLIIMRMHTTETEQRQYHTMFAKSFVCDSKRGKWCPTLGCNHAVMPDDPVNCRLSKYTCNCHLSFCYRCMKEAHGPVSCAMADCWRMEPVKQSQNWELAFCRNCPECGQFLQIKDYNKHLECESCNFHFCGTCLDPWLKSGQWDGDHFTHTCTDEKIIEMAENERIREHSRSELRRFQGNVTKWNDIDLDQQTTILKIQTMRNEELRILSEKLEIPITEMSFVTDAWLQLAECKRMLKWQTVYDYYILVHHEEDKKSFVNYLLSTGAYVMEQLCTVAAQLKQLVDAPPNTFTFEDFRESLRFKTSVARNYFENMEIVIQYGYLTMEALRTMICLRESIQRDAPAPAPAPAQVIMDVGTSSGVRVTGDQHSELVCQHCNFASDGSTKVCVMCYQPFP